MKEMRVCVCARIQKMNIFLYGTTKKRNQMLAQPVGVGSTSTSTLFLVPFVLIFGRIPTQIDTHVGTVYSGISVFYSTKAGANGTK